MMISSLPCFMLSMAGGQNQARAMLTGALAGAQVGHKGIPRHFIDGLENHDELLQLSFRVAHLIGK